MHDWKIGDRVYSAGCQYKIKDIKKGGMGIVYICYDEDKNRMVAAKTFLFDKDDEWETFELIKEGFTREAELWVSLGEHRNIVRAYYIEHFEGFVEDVYDWPFIILEYIEGYPNIGVTLRDYVLKTQMYSKWEFCLAIICEMCRGLEYVYEKLKGDFVHRDIKPENILISKDMVIKITDFGLAKIFDELPDIPPKSIEVEGITKFLFSKKGTACGTPPYMSPEQCLGKKTIDIRSDIYSIGCVLYEMLTKKYVFTVKSAEDFIYHHINSIPINPRSLNKNIPKELNCLIMQCLDKNPEKRYKDISVLRNAIAKLLPEDVKKLFEYYYLNNSKVEYRLLKELNLGGESQIIELIQEGLSYKQLIGTSLGDKKKQENLFEKAIECFKKAEQVDTKNNKLHAYVHLLLANTFKDKTDLFYLGFIDGIRGYRDLLGEHAWKKWKKGFYDLAIVEYREVIKITPEPYQYRSPCENLDYGPKTFPHDAYLNLGYLYCQTNQYESALIIFETFLEYMIKTKVSSKYYFLCTHYLMGDIYYLQGKPNDAINQYKNSLEYSVGTMGKNVRRSLALLYYEIRETRSALIEYENFLKIKYEELSKESIDGIYMLCKRGSESSLFYSYVMEIKGEYQLAIDLYKKTIDESLSRNSTRAALEKTFAEYKLKALDKENTKTQRFVSFIVTSGPMKGHKFVVKSTNKILIGRASEMDINLPEDALVSRIHAEIKNEDNNYFLKDLGSTNGTYLNGEKIENKIQIVDGNLITIGHTTLQFKENIARPKN